ncbi:hypothetical protein [uncultured Dokdonia sp.]|uniref:hypothetical protein n=1 Tax=uncultured Dokdonia sp. TaxID=575653 RepID=UPI00262CB674|nr:hypothetical protein [uncultured Dokdonia sp.]
MTIPEDFTDFLYWVKERTEAFWSVNPKSNDTEFVCEDWAYGAKWIGMTDSEIDKAEKKYAIKFSKNHKAFLKILHTIDRKKYIPDWDFDEDGNDISTEFPFFYNWNEDHKELQESFKWPFESLRNDSKDHFWLKSWGDKPSSTKEKEKIFTDWYYQAPKLIPLRSLRYVISEPIDTDNPILSIYGIDTIIYGGTFRQYLLNELQEELGLLDFVYDKEEDVWHTEPKKEFKNIYDAGYTSLKNRDIPVWKEFLIANGANVYLKK